MSDRTLECARLARRMRWAALIGVTAPYAVVLAPRYLRMARALPERPKEHGLTMAAVGIGVSWSVLVLVVLVLGLVQILSA